MTFALPPGCAVSEDPGSQLIERVYPEPAHPYRTPFQRDRARVIHARAFRRLAGKTQVFTHRHSDHFRSRLTHTMEVAQIARAMASALGLNEDLTEALALVHDIGHPPFGHAGERALDEALQEFRLRFDHNLHALRIVEYFEVRYAAFRGLNLTLGVREGIIKHSRTYSPAEHPELRTYFLDQQPPLEAQLIDLADEIAYLTADMDDGMEAGMLQPEQLRQHVRIFDESLGAAEREYPKVRGFLLANEALKKMLNTLVGDLLRETAQRVKQGGVATLEGIRHFPERLVAFSPPVEELRREAKQYLYATLYSSEELQRDLREAALVVRNLFTCWVNDPSLLPPANQSQIADQGIARVVADYIAGMTDNYILLQYSDWIKGRRSASD
ncbi:MAG TPA: dNTP triphosphohydrolase [Acidobacteriaceae bacterium]|nr:dNTP triphosphohydrolase [Acidobacteriaceae bacterium]